MATSLQSIKYCSPLKSMADLSMKPAELAGKLEENDSILSNIGSRTLMLVQVVTSLVALPILLLLGLLEATFHAITCNGSKATTTLKATLEAMTISFFMPPIALVAAITPECIRDPVINGIGKCAKKVMELWQFNCCKSTHSQTDYDREWNASQPQHTR